VRLVVVTRVAIRWADRVPSGRWVTDRAEMLRRITATTVLASDACWVWRTCPERLDQVTEIASTLHPTPVVVLEDQVTDDRVWPDASRFLTFRLDSDDAYMPTALRPHSVAPGGVVSFDFGYQLDWHAGTVAARKYPSGPFLAVAHDRRERMLTTGGDHGKARHGRRIHHVTEPSWCQVVHGNNLSTSWQNGKPLPPDRASAILKEAGIDR